MVVEGGLNPFNTCLSVFCLYYLQTVIWRCNSLLLQGQQSNERVAWINGEGKAQIRLNYRSRNRVYTNTNVNIIRPDEILLCLAEVYSSVCSRINPSHVSMPPNQNCAMVKAKAVCPRVARLRSNWLDERSGALISHEECHALIGHDCFALRHIYMHKHSIVSKCITYT